MASNSIIVTGWGASDGPAYSVVTSTLDKKRHKRVHATEVVREQKGNSTKKPDHALIEVAGTRHLLLNKGHHYTVTLASHGFEIVGGVDATADYVDLTLDADTEFVRSVAVGTSEPEPVPTETVEDQQGEPVSDHQNDPDASASL